MERNGPTHGVQAMIKDRIVRVKMRKYFREQRPFCYVGKVTGFSEAWIIMEAYGIMISRMQPNGAQIDEKPGAVMIPRESVDNIRVLPDNFDLNNLKISTTGQQLVLVVDGKRDIFIGEMGEG
jgi:hypothetical protein